MIGRLYKDTTPAQYLRSSLVQQKEKEMPKNINFQDKIVDLAINSDRSQSSNEFFLFPAEQGNLALVSSPPTGSHVISRGVLTILELYSKARARRLLLLYVLQFLVSQTLYSLHLGYDPRSRAMLG